MISSSGRSGFFMRYVDSASSPSISSRSLLSSRVETDVADEQVWRIDDGMDAADGSEVEGVATDGASGAEIAS